MKHTLLIIVALVVCFKSQAQLSKGRMMLSGSFNSYNNHQATTDTSVQSNQPTVNGRSFTGSVNFGYFVTNKIVVGIYGSYSNSGGDNKSIYYDGNNYLNRIYKYTGFNFSGGIFSRYYQMLGKSRFALFGQLSAGYGVGKQENKTTSGIAGGSMTTSDSHNDLSSLNIRFNPGIVFFVTKNIAIETSFGNMGFSTQRSKNYNGTNYSETKSSTFNTNLGLSLSNLSWGINFYFGGKKDKVETPGK